MQIKWMMIVLRLHFKWHMPTVFIPDSKIFSYVFWSQVLLFWKEFCNFFFYKMCSSTFLKGRVREREEGILYSLIHSPIIQQPEHAKSKSGGRNSIRVPQKTGRDSGSWTIISHVAGSSAETWIGRWSSQDCNGTP